MNVTRRAFFAAVLFGRTRRPASLEVEVIEAFDLEEKSVAILVHHANAASRQNFATWLQNNPKSSALVRTKSGFETQASIFRVRMCFGRALILLQEPLQLRRGELLTLLT